MLLAPALLLAGTLGGMDWTWWQRLLAGVGGLVLTTYVLLVLLGLRRIRRNRKAQARRAP
ncbi:hypothetical protein AB0K02_29160 [Streptomyces sp. NPDC049597]|uniref:hypothetical protein n=1 Tax=Streptomyces sp. NPDC049597 TaxID=3155276 RepID=UPI00343167A6